MRINCHRPTYISWKGLRNRCRLKNVWNYASYGGAGVTYDPAWDSYERFQLDMGNRPEGMTLDRIDGTRGYFKENCRWATASEQQNNRKCALLLTHNGITKNARDWARDLGLAPGAVWNRVKLLGWSIEKAVTTKKVGTVY
jgi:hypothetical protein